MNRDNGKKYPRTIESKNSYLRIRAPEHLDVALEGLIRKVLKEQPKMDDIYAFAADYFDMLLKIREKAGIRKLSVQDICPQHNEEDANEMIKLASTFTKRKRESKSVSKGYRAISLRHLDHQQEKIGMKTVEKDVKNGEQFNILLPIVNEHPELEDMKPGNSSMKSEKPDSDPEESDLELANRPKVQDMSEKIIEAREVILEEDDEMTTEIDIETEDVKKLQIVENEIQSLKEKGSENFKNGYESGISVCDIVNEIKSDTNDDNIVEEMPIVEEPLEESERMKPNTENEVKIEEITNDGKNDLIMENDEMKENLENPNTIENETKTEDIQELKETITEVESIVQQVQQVTPNEIPNTFDEILAEEMQDSKVNHATKNQSEDTMKVDQIQGEKSSPEITEEEQSEKIAEENWNDENDDEETREENLSDEAAKKDAETDMILVEEQEEKLRDECTDEDPQKENASDEVLVENVQEEIPANEDMKEGKSSEKNVVEEMQEGTLSTKIDNEEGEEKEPSAGTESVEALQENTNKKIVTDETSEGSKEYEVDKTEDVEPKIGESPEIIPDEAEESETKLETENILEEPVVTDSKVQDGIEEVKDISEKTENDANEESLGMEVLSTNTIQSEEAKLMEEEKEGKTKNEKSEIKEFIDLEKHSEHLQNLSGIPTEVNLIVEKVRNEDAIVQQDTKEKEDEKYIREPVTEDDCSENTEGLNSAAQGTIVIASGLAAAAVVDQMKKELIILKPEEITEKEETEEDEIKSTVEEVLLKTKPQKEELTLTEEVEKFLNRERQHSSYDKEAEELVDEMLQEDKTTEALEAEVVNKNISNSLARMTLPENEVKDEKTLENKEELGPSDVEVEGDDQDRDGSTTSDEIEFDISPLKNPEIIIDSEKNTVENNSHGENSIVNIQGNNEKDSEKDMEEKKADVNPESRTIELNKNESEEQTIKDNKEDAATEQPMVFLEVPEPIMEEYLERKMAPQEYQLTSNGNNRPLENESVNAEEVVILDCSNVGNEIIKTAEIQKVKLIEGEEDILQVHLTTTIETVQENGDSLHVQMTSKVDPTFEISVETKMDSPVLDEKMRLVRAAIIIQNGFRRFKKRKVTGEPLDVSTDELDTSTMSESKLDLSIQTTVKNASSRESGSSFSSSATKISKGHNLSRSATRTLLETHSLDQTRKITPLKTRSLSTVRYGVADFEVWNQLVKELEEAATKIQSKYRGYKTRKKLQRENAIQSTTTTSEESSTTNDSTEVIHRHTGEFHDIIVLPLLPR